MLAKLKKQLRQVRYIAETIALIPILFILYLLPMGMAAAFFGKILRYIGPLLPVSKIALHNLANALPHLNSNQHNNILIKMWENLGMLMGETLHWHRLSEQDFYKKVAIVDHSNGEFFKNHAAIAISGHMGNWEIYPWIYFHQKLKFTILYRHANNPAVNKLLTTLRCRAGGLMLNKGFSSMREVVKSIKNQEHLAMLVDQKTNTGIMVPFFGRLAPTTALPANMTIKFSCPIYLTRVVRLKGSNFRVEIMPALKLKSNDDPAAVMLQINNQLEKWIMEFPEQWFWVHRRWGKN
jgi:KDO2-lipid IV(A) lauroyltransferase